MSVVNLKSKTDSAGALHLNLGVPDLEVDVTVVIADESSVRNSQEEWTAFVKRTAGSIQDPAFRRYPEGDYPVREQR